MSVASELSTLAANKAEIKSAIAAKNPAVQPTDALAQWPTAIASIPSGGGGDCALSLPRYNNEGGIISCELIVDGVDYADPSTRPAIVKKSSPFTVVVRDPIRYGPTIKILKPDGSESTLSKDVPFTVDNVMMLTRIYAECLIRGTLVALADGTAKPIEEIDYCDKLLVWDFERGETAAARPLWIKKAERVNYKYAVRFASGNTLDVTGPHGHRAFNMDQSRFEYLPRSVGDGVYTLKGVDSVVACEYVEGDFEFYNIITAGHLNLFANGILTSCRLNNCRAFDADRMKWASKAVFHHPCSDFDELPDGWFDGLRLCEQSAPLEKLVAYVSNLVNTAK